MRVDRPWNVSLDLMLGVAALAVLGVFIVAVAGRGEADAPGHDRGPAMTEVHPASDVARRLDLEAKVRRIEERLSALEDAP